NYAIIACFLISISLAIFGSIQSVGAGKYDGVGSEIDKQFQEILNLGNHSIYGEDTDKKNTEIEAAIQHAADLVGVTHLVAICNKDIYSGDWESWAISKIENFIKEDFPGWGFLDTIKLKYKSYNRKS